VTEKHELKLNQEGAGRDNGGTTLLTACRWDEEGKSGCFVDMVGTYRAPTTCMDARARGPKAMVPKARQGKPAQTQTTARRWSGHRDMNER